MPLSPQRGYGGIIPGCHHYGAPVDQFGLLSLCLWSHTEPLSLCGWSRAGLLSLDGGPEQEVEKRIAEAVASEDVVGSLGRIVWTGSMRRMFTLVERCLEHAEAVLLVGDTGCGKTTACQLAALVRGQRIHILNCHQRTETSDIIGVRQPRAVPSLPLPLPPSLLQLLPQARSLACLARLPGRRHEFTDVPVG